MKGSLHNIHFALPILNLLKIGCLLIFAGLFPYCSIQAQAKHDLYLDSRYSNSLKTILIDDEGYRYLSGKFQQSLKYEDQELWRDKGEYFLIKLDSAYQLQWSLQFPFPIRKISLGYSQIYLSGHFRRDFTWQGQDFSTQNGYFRSLLLALDQESGALKWHKELQAERDILVQGMTSDSSGVYLLGSFEGDFQVEGLDFKPKWFKNLYLIKYSSQGNIGWGKHISGGFNSLTGVFARDLVIDRQGNLFFGGTVCGQVEIEGQRLYSSMENFYAEGRVFNHDIIIARFDSQKGELKWLKAFAQHAELGQLKIDSQACVYMSGYFRGSGNRYHPNRLGEAHFGKYILHSGLDTDQKPTEDSFLAKLSPLGNYIWVKQLQAPSHNRGLAISLSTKGKRVFWSGSYQEEIKLVGENWALEKDSDKKPGFYWLCFEENGKFIQGKSLEDMQKAQLSDMIQDPQHRLFMVGRTLSRAYSSTSGSLLNGFIRELKLPSGFQD